MCEDPLKDEINKRREIALARESRPKTRLAMYAGTLLGEYISRLISRVRESACVVHFSPQTIQKFADVTH